MYHKRIWNNSRGIKTLILWLFNVSAVCHVPQSKFHKLSVLYFVTSNEIIALLLGISVIHLSSLSKIQD